MTVLDGMFSWLVGLAAGVGLAAPIWRRATTAAPRTRAATLTADDLPGRPRAGEPQPSEPRPSEPRPAASGRQDRARDWLVERTRPLRGWLARRRDRRRDLALAREVPVLVDLVAVAASAGCTPYLALEHAARWAPPLSALELERVRRAGRLGVALEEALRETSRARPQIRSVCDALSDGVVLGTPLVPMLARVADEQRTRLRRASEERARQVPVRLLFPLVLLILPAFVLLTVVPGVAEGLGAL